MPGRSAELSRKTTETDIRVAIDLDGRGRSRVASGVGFLDHMLTAFAAHSRVDLDAECRGDLHVDAHHSTEDLGIAIGAAIDRALGDRAGIRRYGHAILPMDEALAMVAVDLGGRPFVAWDAPMPSQKIGEFDSELVQEFWRGLAVNARMNLHVRLLAGSNAHHVSEAIFKGAARAIRAAIEPDPRVEGVPSTKGTL